MDGLKVSQLAERAGVPATTLRFYEQQGLLSSRRSVSGYRLFDDDAVDQLRFIDTAKRLGLSLDEVRSLLSPWRQEGCREVQRTLTPMLGERAREAREQIACLEEFAARLDEARRLLAVIDHNGPCDRSCVFLRQQSAAPAAARSTVAASAPAPARPAASPHLPVEPRVAAGSAQLAGSACSLPGPAWHGRRGRWARVLTHATSRRRLVEGRVHVELDPAVLDGDGAAELVALVRAEQDCCPSLAMAMTVGATVVVEASTQDAGADGVVEALFGPFEDGSSAIEDATAAAGCGL